jgi:hypothetical protein
MPRLVLIDRVRHHEVMFGLVLIPLLAVVALAVYVYGADSRIDDVTRRRGYNG